MLQRFAKYIAGGAAAAAAILGGAGIAHADAATITPGSGSQGTTITLLPPSGAACSGTAPQGYRVESFIIDASVNPTTLTYDNLGPHAPGGALAYPLFDTVGGQWSQKNPALTPAGQVIDLTTINLQIFADADVLPTGDYKIGYACSLNGVAETASNRHWETTIHVTKTGNATLTFGPIVPPAQVPEAPLSVLLPLTGAALLGAGVIVKRRRAAGVAA